MVVVGMYGFAGLPGGAEAGNPDRIRLESDCAAGAQKTISFPVSADS